MYGVELRKKTGIDNFFVSLIIAWIRGTLTLVLIVFLSLVLMGGGD